MERRRQTDFSAYKAYEPPFLRLSARVLPFMVAIVVLVIASFVTAFMFRDSYVPAWIMLACTPLIALMSCFGRKVRCPECRKFLDKYLDIDVDTEDTYGFIYVCENCRHYFKEQHRVG